MTLVNFSYSEFLEYPNFHNALEYIVIEFGGVPFQLPTPYDIYNDLLSEIA